MLLFQTNPGLTVSFDLKINQCLVQIVFIYTTAFKSQCNRGMIAIHQLYSLIVGEEYSSRHLTSPSTTRHPYVFIGIMYT